MRDIGNGPVFPLENPRLLEKGDLFKQCPGITVRQYAAIHLRLAASGDDWLDLMIRQANLRDIATAALAGMLGGETDTSSYQDDAAARRACRMAEHLLVEIDGDFNEI